MLLFSIFAFGTLTSFDLLSKQGRSFFYSSYIYIIHYIYIYNTYLVSGASSDKVSELDRYLPEKYTLFPPFFSPGHEGKVCGTDPLMTAEFVAASGVI